MIAIWKTFTPLEKHRQGGAVAMSLRGPAQEAVLEIPAEEINADNGIV